MKWDYKKLVLEEEILMLLNMPYKRYEENTVFTSSSEELTLILYNGLIKFIIQAQIAAEEKNIEKSYNDILKAKKIILYLKYTLDMKYEISEGLMNIYEYMYRRLTDANIKKESSIFEEVIGFAREMRDTWAKAIKIAKKEYLPKQVSG
jgi:flagellar protein FliS